RSGFQTDLVRKRAPIGVGVHRKDPVATQGRECGPECDRGRGLAGPALEAEHGDPLVAGSHRGAGAADEFALAQYFGGFSGVDQAQRGSVYGLAPTSAGSLAPVAHECGGVEGIGGLPTFRFVPYMRIRPCPDGVGSGLCCRWGVHGGFRRLRSLGLGTNHVQGRKLFGFGYVGITTQSARSERVGPFLNGSRTEALRTLTKFGVRADRTATYLFLRGCVFLGSLFPSGPSPFLVERRRPELDVGKVRRCVLGVVGVGRWGRWGPLEPTEPLLPRGRGGWALRNLGGRITESVATTRRVLPERLCALLGSGFWDCLRTSARPVLFVVCHRSSPG